VHIIELVVAELEEELAVVVLLLHEVRIAEPDPGRAVGAVKSGANLTPIAEVAADVESASASRSRKSATSSLLTNMGRSRTSIRALGAANQVRAAVSG